MVDFAGSLAQAGKSAVCTPGRCSPVSPISGLWSQGTLRRSQVPREPHCAFAVFSDSGRASVPSLRGTSVLPPDNRTRRASTTCSFRSSITWPQHWLFTLRAAIAGDDAKLASGGGQPFPGGIPIYPLSSVGKFRPFGLPFPWASPVAICFLLSAFARGWLCGPKQVALGWLSGGLLHRYYIVTTSLLHRIIWLAGGFGVSILPVLPRIPIADPPQMWERKDDESRAQ